MELKNPAYVITLAVASFLILAIAVIFFVVLYQRRVIRHQLQMRDFQRQKQVDLLHASIQGEEEERMRIATELHDDVGATLSSIRLFLTQAEQKPGDSKLIAYSKTILDELIQKVRNLSHQLQPRTLQYLGLIKALESLVEMISRSGFISAALLNDSDSWEEPEPVVALSVYRIVQELTNNILKHANASWIEVRMQSEEGQHSISISHDGNGLTEEMYQKQLFKKGAIGLKNIENRLESSGLSLIFPQCEADYHTIMISLPQ